jgi:hypothetical protein
MDPSTLGLVVRTSGPLLSRFLDGFNDENRTTQAPGLPNHAAWTLGHCALTMHRLAEALDGGALPEQDFVHGEGRDGDHRRYDTQSICFRSVPMVDPARYPALERGQLIFEAAVQRLACAVEGSASLDAPLQWHGQAIVAGRLVARVAFHNGCHGGQLTDLRRALGFPPVIQ